MRAAMSSAVRLVAHEAYADLLQRTLSRMPCELSRLIYLASTRDYNTGTYHHEGLAAQFRRDLAQHALEVAHQQSFRRLSTSSVEKLVAEVDTYLRSSREKPVEVLRAWQKLEPYRVAIPMEVDPTAADLFLSNIKLALVILLGRQQAAQSSQ